MGVVDILDIIVCASCMFLVYKLIRGTVAFYIALGFLMLYLLSLVFKMLNMNLMGTLTSQFFSIGFIILVVVFQPEIRQILILLGSNLLKGRYNFLAKLLKVHWMDAGLENESIRKSISGALTSLSVRKTGALLVFADEDDLFSFKETGVRIDAQISQMLIESIFQKSSPLHDGAVLIVKNRLYSASSILPLSYDPTLPFKYGLRHRAAIGACDVADVFALVVSEESGHISYVSRGKIEELKDASDIEQLLEKKGI